MPAQERRFTIFEEHFIVKITGGALSLQGLRGGRNPVGRLFWEVRKVGDCNRDLVGKLSTS